MEDKSKNSDINRDNVIEKDNETDNKIDNETDNKNAGDEKEYDLYTERIVPGKRQKYKMLLRVLQLFILAALLSIIILLIAFKVLPWIKQEYFTEPVMQETVHIEKDSYDSGKSSEAYANRPMDEEMLKLLSAMENSIRSSQVKLFLPESDAGYTGVCIADANDSYYVLSSLDMIKDVENTSDLSFNLTFSGSAEVKGQFSASIDSLNIILVSVAKSQLSEEERSNIKTAKLGNSYILADGDIAVGVKTATDNTAEYHTLTGKEEILIIDNELETLNFGEIDLAGDFACLYNYLGEIVCVSCKVDDKTDFVGISDIKGALENLLNYNAIIYCGVKGDTVTDEISMQYGVPKGIYVEMTDYNSPAFYAGIQAGDVITEINGEEVNTIKRFNEILTESNNGQLLKAKVKRKGKDEYIELEFAITLGLK